MSSPSSLTSGLIALHGNRTEWLLDAVASWLAEHPLAPLEPEVILVQSNGMAEWVKMALAREVGVCAAAQVQLPARFQWQIYRQVLGRHQVPTSSPFDKIPLTWRLMHLLPAIKTQPGFEPIAHYLAKGEAMHCFQLASRIADLFDQYQVHRPDWLDAWARGKEILRNAAGQTSPLPDDQRWQARLWQTVLGTLAPEQRQLSRAALHTRVLEVLNAPADLFDSQEVSLLGSAGALPRRVVLFGMTHVPRPTLELLGALANHCQVLLAVPNPSRFHWADAIDGRQWLRSQRRRMPLRGEELAGVELESMHLHAHPLLAAWGRQARDFIRQLDEFDDANQTRERFPQARIDLFEEDIPPEASLLQQVQCHIRDFVPLNEHPRVPVASSDRSIEFHIAHSPVRELEILHDQLLKRLAQATTDKPLRPRDIVVMVPAIDNFAPAIRAVFGQYPVHDPRYIPFDIADLSARSNSPLLQAIQWLLNLAQGRCRLSELGALLDVPAIAARFDLNDDDIPRLLHWLRGAGIRWGLDAEHRSDLGLGSCGDTNTVLFGLQRMLMGYAAGQLPAELEQPFANIEPHDEVGGLEAGLAGSFARLVASLRDWYEFCREQATPIVWAERLRQLLGAFVRAQDDEDRQMLAALEQAVETWLQACEDAGFNVDLPLDVVAEAWMETLDTPSLDQRFRAGGVTFCTLMPMRAIPFQVVCLLGMDDGAYPRRTPRSDFDLLALPGQQRPGDRARRDDDRQLMLEALLSAREALHVSWCGRSVRDNTEQPPSVLVTQLRDYLSEGWGPEVVEQRTVVHPLQPFSRRYFEVDSELHTYAREWRTVHQTYSDTNLTPPVTDSAAALTEFTSNASLKRIEPLAFTALPFTADPDVTLDLASLTRFLRRPVATFFQQRLGVVFQAPEDALPDDETFLLTGLTRYEQLQRTAENVIATWLNTANESPLPASAEPEAVWSAIDHELKRSWRRGDLPLGGPGNEQAEALRSSLALMLQAWLRERDAHPLDAERIALHFEHQGLTLADWVRMPMRSLSATEPIWLEVKASQLMASKQETRRKREDEPMLDLVRGQHLLRPWLLSLVSAASNQPCGGRLIGRDATLLISPMRSQELARAGLARVLDAWMAGMRQPLPVALNTSLAALQEIHSKGEEPTQDPHTLHKARLAYDGNDHHALGAEREEPCLQRCFPSYDHLAAQPDFLHWAQTLYGPLRDWAQEHVTVEWHPEPGVAPKPLSFEVSR